MPGKTLSNYLRTFRLRAGLSQEEVAALLGVASGSEVSRHETFRRMPSLATALRYEAIFGIPVRELFSGEYQKVELEVQARAQELADRIASPDYQGGQMRQLLARILNWS
jgi:transcriptional regulator with XRE-family HTH domain